MSAIGGKADIQFAARDVRCWEKRTFACRLTQLSSHHLLCIEDIFSHECCLGIVCHHFQWTISISKALQSVGIRTKELFGSKIRH